MNHASSSFLGFDTVNPNSIPSHQRTRSLSFFAGTGFWERLHAGDSRRDFSLIEKINVFRASGHPFTNAVDQSSPHSGYDVSRVHEHGFIPQAAFMSFSFRFSAVNAAAFQERALFMLDELLISLLESEAFVEVTFGDRIVTSVPLDVCISRSTPERSILKSMIPGAATIYPKLRTITDDFHGVIPFRFGEKSEGEGESLMGLSSMRALLVSYPPILYLAQQNSRDYICILCMQVPIQRKYLIAPYETGKAHLKFLDKVEEQSALFRFLSSFGEGVHDASPFHSPRVGFSIAFDVKHHVYGNASGLERMFVRQPHLEMEAAAMPRGFEAHNPRTRPTSLPWDTNLYTQPPVSSRYYESAVAVLHDTGALEESVVDPAPTPADSDAEENES